MSIVEVISLNETKKILSAAQTLTLALQDDPLFVYILPHPEERLQKLPGLFAANVRFSYLFGEVFTTSGDLEGVAVWQPPGVDITPERAVQAGYDQLGIILGKEAHRRLGRLLDYLSANHHPLLPSEHWYLTALGVIPERQRQGIGRALLEPVLSLADEAGVPCCLDTSLAQNLSFYENLGFRVLVESAEPESGIHFWTLCRSPNS